MALLTFVIPDTFVIPHALSQVEQVETDKTDKTASESYGASVPASLDANTLNLHRWGAVTLFHGLPSDRVNAIAEDANGLLWFGTDNGLVRYDGRNVEAAPNEAELPSRKILVLKLDHHGQLWIGTEMGAARLHENRIEVLPETRNRQVKGIAASPQGEVTVVTDKGEIIRYQEQTEGGIRSEGGARKRLVAMKLDPDTHPLLKSPKQENKMLPLAAITSTSASGVEWLIGSRGRGLLINRANDLREASTKSPRPYFISSIHDDGERVWLAENASEQAGGLWFWEKGVITRTSLGAGAVTAVHGGDGELWAGTSKEGAFLLKLENGDVRRIEHLTFENTNGGLRSNQIHAIFRDREGVVWFGSDRGVCRYDRSSLRASKIRDRSQSDYVRAMLHASDGETWCGTNNGLFKLTTSDGVTGLDSWAEVAELHGRSVYTLIEIDGAVWAGSSGGLFVKPKGGSSFSRVPPAPSATITITGADEAEPPASGGTQPPVSGQTQPQLPGQTQPPAQDPAAPQPQVASEKEDVRAIAGFRGQIYVAYYGRGIERIDNNASGLARAPILTDAAARFAICFAVERRNNTDAALWFGTTNGELRRFDGSQTVSYALPQKTSGAERGVRSIAITDRGMWIGSSQGLYLREGSSIREIKPDLETRTLPELDVRSLFVTREAAPENAPREVIWIATSNAGLIKLLPDQEIFARFDTELGLASKQVFAVAPGANNEIWIGTNRGVARHRPSAIEPRLRIKRLVADKIYTPEELTAELSLPHTASSLLLEVLGVGSKTFPSQFQYEFALLDGNNKLVKRVQKREPQFPAENLPSGPYTIVSRAISRDLVYSAPLNFRFRIDRAPPPWPLLLLASLLAVAVTAAALAFRQQRRFASANRALEKTNLELTETRLLLANETEAERSRIARDLHDQTLADLRHLLVMTDQLSGANPSSVPSSGSPSAGDDSAPTPAALRREIEVISNEIRHICEDLSPSALENIGFLPALEWALSNAVAQLPTEEKFAYEFICDANLEDRLRLSHIERIQLYRMVQEGLNNICRHARARQVKMEVRAENSADLVIEIRDDGVGFDGARINRTGHGIANIRSRANLIGAKVDWKNALPGCRFEIRKDGCVIEV
ncbi:MAG TPA: two-component regulator propeller domain-containing protein [Blastocatellia bacterium]|nr:two-component regulator propeller domain-containing protein [Blastocatellia bacterium]